MTTLDLNEIASEWGERFHGQGLIPDRVGLTGDSSVLFQFLRGRKACVDIFDSGVVVVLTKAYGQDSEEVRDLYELDINDPDTPKLVFAILKNGHPVETQ